MGDYLLFSTLPEKVELRSNIQKSFLSDCHFFLKTLKSDLLKRGREWSASYTELFLCLIHLVFSFVYKARNVFMFLSVEVYTDAQSFRVSPDRPAKSGSEPHGISLLEVLLPWERLVGQRSGCQRVAEQKHAAAQADWQAVLGFVRCITAVPVSSEPFAKSCSAGVCTC